MPIPIYLSRSSTSHHLSCSAKNDEIRQIPSIGARPPLNLNDKLDNPFSLVIRVLGNTSFKYTTRLAVFAPSQALKGLLMYRASEIFISHLLPETAQHPTETEMARAWSERVGIGCDDALMFDARSGFGKPEGEDKRKR